MRWEKTRPHQKTQETNLKGPRRPGALRSGPCRGPESPTAGPPSVPPGRPHPRERRQARGGRPATAGPPGATLKPIGACFMTRGCRHFGRACNRSDLGTFQSRSVFLLRVLQVEAYMQVRSNSYDGFEAKSARARRILGQLLLGHPFHATQQIIAIPSTIFGR